MSRLQLNFNGGEIDPDEHERVDLDVYLSGLARGENIVLRPHGGLSRRGGTQAFGRIRHQLTALGPATATITAPNGGITEDLAAGEAFETVTTIPDDQPYVVAEFEFDDPVAITAWDFDFFLNDGSPEAGGEAGGGGTVAPTQPEDPPPTRPPYTDPRYDGFAQP